MKINLKQELKDLSGEVLKVGDETLTVGKALANIVVSAEQGGKMKLFILGTNLYTKEELEVDSADLNLIKDCVKTTKVYGGSLVSGQLELLLEELF
jgi:hypothetical protein